MDFRRIEDALADRAPGSVTYLVLTLKDRSIPRAVAFRSLWRKWQSLYQWIRRRWGGKPPYVATVEAHLDGGWPHVNVLLVMGEDFARELGTEKEPGSGRSMIIRETKVHALHAGEKSRVTQGTGWGWQLSWERARSARAVAGYILKLAGQDATTEGHGQVVGEAIKLSQVPMHAPPRFRRIRASRGFLAPAYRGVHADWTGGLWKVPELQARLLWNRGERWLARRQSQWRRGPAVDRPLRDREILPLRTRGPPDFRDPLLGRRFLLRAQAGVAVAPRIRIRWRPWARIDVRYP